MALEAIRRMLRERKMLADAAALERELRRLAEVKAAFFEGMEAGYDRSWMERQPEAYWLESDTRRALYHGPPLPNDVQMRLKAARGRRGRPYDPQRDPGRVIAP